MDIAMVEMLIRRVQTNAGTYFRVVLQEKNGAACLDIVIGPSEAGAISAAHEGQKPVRPLSYDLACSLLDEVNARIDRVEITALHDGIYYAEIHLQDANGLTKAIDSRPSDAIALALRTDAPIFAAEEILQEEESEDLTAIRDPNLSGAADEDEEDGDSDKPSGSDVLALGVVADCEIEGHAEAPSIPKELVRESGSGHEALSALELFERRLRHAVSEEAYEEAARLRDRIAEIHRGS